MRISVVIQCLLALSFQVSAETSQPNILLLMAEDMSPRVGAFGDSVAVTPNLDALAKQGVRYPNTFTTAGVCAPSRAAHILGAHQISTGTQHMRAGSNPDGAYYSVPPAQMKAYPELLRRAGYYTYTDIKLDYQFSGTGSNSGPTTLWDQEGVKASGWRAREPEQPFFGFRNFLVTHESGLMPPLGTMPRNLKHLRAQLMHWWVTDGAPPQIVDPKSVTLPPYYADTPTVRRDLARHYDNISYMDAEVGAILAQLQADGLADSTIVIWTTDHGDGLPRAKRDLFDSGIKVPMIIRWPKNFRPAGVEPGSLDSRLISFVDLAPTVLKLAGVDVPEYIQGQDFASAESPHRQYIYASRDRIDEVADQQRAVRDERFKYIRSDYPEQGEGHPLAFRDNINMVREMRALYEAGELNSAQRQWYEAPGKERLFDLEADPFELNDLSEDPRYFKVLTRLQQALDTHLTEIEDWSEKTEAQMVARFETAGNRVVTPPPRMHLIENTLHMDPSAPGSSLTYRVNGGPWRLYTGPVALSTSGEAEGTAVRYGWAESEKVLLEI